MDTITEIASEILMHSTMNFLNVIAIIFSVWRIILSKLGWISYRRHGRPPDVKGRSCVGGIYSVTQQIVLFTRECEDISLAK